MRSATWGWIVISVGIAALVGLAHWNLVLADGVKPRAGRDAADLIALSSDGGGDQQQVTIINTRTRVMSVYHIEHSSGAITLKSVRNIEADLMMDEFNTGNPLPREIRAMLSNR